MGCTVFDYTSNKRLSKDSPTIDYEIENRPHAPGLPGDVMGGLFVRIFAGFLPIFRSGWRTSAPVRAGGAGDVLRRLVVFLPI